MGCCIGISNDISMCKELIINLGPKEINDFILRDEANPKSIWNKKIRKSSSKTADISDESPRKSKRRKKSLNYHNQKIKDIAKNLQLIAISEVKNVHKFFQLK